MKLVLDERESAPLRRFLAVRSTPLVTSALSQVEVLRAVARHPGDGVRRGRRLLAELHQLALDAELLDDAAMLAPPTLRALDAIHLAAARTLLPSLRAMVTYDQRMADAARTLGLPVEAPA